MFPFNIPAGAFLVLYVAVAFVTVSTAGAAARRAAERSPLVQLPLLNDPYEIAYARAGAAEVVRVAVLSLIDRELIAWNTNDDTVVATPLASTVTPRRRIEQAILDAVRTQVRSRELLDKRFADIIEQSIGTPLRRGGYVTTVLAVLRQQPWLSSTWALLTALAGIKTIVALGEGHSNVGFLVVLWILSTVGLIRQIPQTREQAMLEQLRSLLRDLRHRAETLLPGSATNELALLVATFGFDVVPARMAPYAKGIQRELRRQSDGGSGCGGGGGSGCGGGCGGCGGG